MDNQPKIEKIIMACPYCLKPQHGKVSCCGEAHFETAYEVAGTVYLESEVKIKEN